HARVGALPQLAIARPQALHGRPAAFTSSLWGRLQAAGVLVSRRWFCLSETALRMQQRYSWLGHIRPFEDRGHASKDDPQPFWSWDAWQTTSRKGNVSYV